VNSEVTEPGRTAVFLGARRWLMARADLGGTMHLDGEWREEMHRSIRRRQHAGERFTVKGAATALQCIPVSSRSLQRRGVDSRPLGVIEEAVVCCGLLTETEERKKRGRNVGSA
jgi:hypothetical protein